ASRCSGERFIEYLCQSRRHCSRGVRIKGFPKCRRSRAARQAQRLPQELGDLLRLFSWGAPVSESDQMASLRLMQNSDDTAFFVKNREKRSVGKDIRENFGGGVVSRIRSEQQQRMRVEQDLKCLQIRHAPRMLVDERLDTCIFRRGQHLVLTSRVVRVGCSDKVQPQSVEDLGCALES